MWQTKEKQRERQQRALEWQVRWRWPLTIFILLNIFLSLDVVIEKRSQWPLAFRFILPPGVPIRDAVWVDIFDVVLCTLMLVSLWVAVHNYRRDLLLAEQLALQKTALPEGVWPPPPVP